MNCSVITFPGSNCDHDAMFATEYSGWKVKNVWHEDKNLPIGTDLVIIPGGFSYGDYLRSGAIARFSPIMTDVIKFAQKGGYIIGICNGFQILTESQLLPGILLKNKTLSFICKDVHLVVENNQTSFTNKYSKNEIIRLPIAHGDGNYYADEEIINELESEGRVVFRYSDSQGKQTEESNPNGSINNIAGIINARGNVLGMMPHPERYVDKTVGGDDGLRLFLGIMESL